MSERIKTDQTVGEMLEAMTERNPGALSVISTLMEQNPLAVLDLDSAQIYGSGIWVLWKNVCDYKIEKLNEVLQKFKTGQLKTDVKLLASYGVTEAGMGSVPQLRKEMGW